MRAPCDGDALSPQLSVVIPAYNEAKVIGATLEEVAAHLTARGLSHEIVVVDDGSTDDTTAVVGAAAARLPAVRLVRAAHGGKGAAVRRGMLDAQGTWLLFMDADHATRIQQFDRFEPVLRRGAPVAIGSRRISGAAIDRHQPRLREALGWVFTRISNLIVGVGVSDFTCGFKCFAREPARRIFALQRLAGWGFDAEILFIARRLGYPIAEVPVVWADGGATKVRLGRDVLGSFSELLAIRAGWLRGWYPRT